MIFENFINFINPLKSAWWYEGNWKRVDRKQVYKITGKCDCPSWECERWEIHKYKHKDTCEVRWIKHHHYHSLDKTFFEKPEKENLMSNYEIYEGPKYE